jgi:hypothetical protein
MEACNKHHIAKLRQFPHGHTRSHHTHNFQGCASSTDRAQPSLLQQYRRQRQYTTHHPLLLLTCTPAPRFTICQRRCKFTTFNSPLTASTHTVRPWMSQRQNDASSPQSNRPSRMRLIRGRRLMPRRSSTHSLRRENVSIPIHRV